MKKMTVIFSVILVLVVMSSIFAYAAPRQNNFRGHTRIGHPGWDRHPWQIYHHTPLRHYQYSPGFFWGGRILLGSSYSYLYHTSPPLFIEQNSPVYFQSREESTDYWYYCRDPEGFYPYIKTCPCGWLKVVPETTPPQ